MKILNIINSVPSLKALLEQKMKISTTYKLSKIINEVNIISESYDSMRKDILDEHATISDDGTQYLFGDDDAGVQSRKDYDTEISKFLDDEIEFSFDKLTMDEIGELELTVSGFQMIEWLVAD